MVLHYSYSLSLLQHSSCVLRITHTPQLSLLCRSHLTHWFLEKYSQKKYISEYSFQKCIHQKYWECLPTIHRDGFLRIILMKSQAARHCLSRWKSIGPKNVRVTNLDKFKHIWDIELMENSATFWFWKTNISCCPNRLNENEWQSLHTASSSNSWTPDSKVHGANMGLTWVLSAPDGPHVGPMNLAIRDAKL